MRLICRLLGHNADPASARWNGSLCFGRCGRCGHDLVRAVDGRWQLPRGYRIVWRSAEDRRPVALEPDEPEADEESAIPEIVADTDSVPSVAQERTEWPIRKLITEQSSDSCAGTATPFLPAETPPAQAADLGVGDFMEDQPDNGDWHDFASGPQRMALG